MMGSLMAARRFAPLFWCQALSAFNDNFIKNVLVILILYGIGATAPAGNAGSLVTLAGALLIVPFMVLSGLGGELADRFDKAVVARWVKIGDIAVAGLAAAGFALASLPVLMACVLGLGVLAALFGPIKYGILPEQLATAEVPAGNALIEGGTFLAILLGTTGGGLAVGLGHDAVLVGILMVAVALAGWISALFIPKIGGAAPDLPIDANILRSTWRLLGTLSADRRLLGGSIATSWFWLAGAVMLSLVPTLARNVVGGAPGVVTLFLSCFSIGIGLGSIAAARLAAGRIVLLLGPIGAVLMGVFGLDIGWIAAHWATSGEPLDVAGFLAARHGIRLAIDLTLMAAAGGLYIVPVFAAVQIWAPARQRARVVAGVNVLSAIFMAAGSLALAALQASGVAMPTLLVGLGVLNILAGLSFLRLLPISPLRDAILLYFRLAHRLEVRNIEHLEGTAPRRIIAINHVSFLDAPLILALLDTDPVFAIDRGIAERWWVKPFLKLARAFPLDPTRPIATRGLVNAVRDGQTLVIFPEGRITTTGGLMKVYDGAGMIADRSDAEIVPVRIQGLEATPFSRLSSDQVKRRLFGKVTLTFEAPRHLTIDPALRGRKRRQAAGAALYDVMSDLVYRTTPTGLTIYEAFLAAGRRTGLGRVVLEDPLTGALTYRRARVAVAVLARKILPLTARGETVGVMLPNANGAIITVLALQAGGRVPAMLNYTAGAGNLVAAVATAQVKTILISRTFVEKAHLELAVDALERVARLVWLEDVRKSISPWDKAAGFLSAGRRLARVNPDDLAAVLFTSGSEGAPKGVALSHRNILANCAQVAARIDFGASDTIFNVLPVFHAFGLMAGLVLPVTSGVKVYSYPSPLHYRIIPELIYGTNATVVLGTDTFLAGYGRTANPYDFRSLRLVVAGAEPVRAETRRLYAEKFGLRILEGYGVTETSPVLALNTPMFNRNGTVGRLMPDLEVRLDAVDGIAEGGRLKVRGPNVMLGYMLADRPGAIQPPLEGWHDTGDIVAIDADGFAAIKGRAKRFAKIAGEMVSLAAVEALLSDLWPEAAVAVHALPDPKRGEKLVLLTTHPGATTSQAGEHLRTKGASGLMAPSEVRILGEMPLLGSGKVDHVSLARVLREEQPA